MFTVWDALSLFTEYDNDFDNRTTHFILCFTWSLYLLKPHTRYLSSRRVYVPEYTLYVFYKYNSNGLYAVINYLKTFELITVIKFCIRSDLHKCDLRVLRGLDHPKMSTSKNHIIPLKCIVTFSDWCYHCSSYIILIKLFLRNIDHLSCYCLLLFEVQGEEYIKKN